MVKENRFRDYTANTWREGFEALQRAPDPWREQATRAVEALLAKLRRYTTEDELHAAYWQVGDWPAASLLRHLSFNPGPDTVLELEDAAFWLRHQELAEGS
jgi:hypothetical protein